MEKVTLDFANIFLDVVSTLYRAKEFTGILPSVSVEGSKSQKKVVLNLDVDTWQVFVDLGEILGIPPNVLLAAISTSVATYFLEKSVKYKKIKELRNNVET